MGRGRCGFLKAEKGERRRLWAAAGKVEKALHGGIVMARRGSAERKGSTDRGWWRDGD